jgi:hypothetical protein
LIDFSIIMYKKMNRSLSFSEISKFNIFTVLTLQCPFFKVMLLRIGNPTSPLMCCPLQNTETSQCGRPYKRFVSFDLGGHDFQARNCSDCQICQNWDLGTPVANHTKQKALRDVMVVLVAFFFFCYIC